MSRLEPGRSNSPGLSESVFELLYLQHSLKNGKLEQAKKVDMILLKNIKMGGVILDSKNICKFALQIGMTGHPE